MWHGVKRQCESPEKEAARLEKEKAQISDYRTLAADVLTRVSSIANQIRVNHLSLGCRGVNDTTEIAEFIKKLEKGDPMWAVIYQEWQVAIEAN